MDSNLAHLVGIVPSLNLSVTNGKSIGDLEVEGNRNSLIIILISVTCEHGSLLAPAARVCCQGLTELIFIINMHSILLITPHVVQKELHLAVKLGWTRLLSIFSVVILVRRGKDGLRLSCYSQLELFGW